MHPPKKPRRDPLEKSPQAGTAKSIEVRPSLGIHGASHPKASLRNGSSKLPGTRENFQEVPSTRCQERPSRARLLLRAPSGL